MTPEVWVDGRPLTSIAVWGELEVTHRWPLGSWESKWSMPLDPWWRPAELHAGADVRVQVGPHVIWGGNLAEPDWSSGEFAAVGACRQAEGAISLDNATGQTTSIPNKAVDDAITRGKLDWTRPGSISAVALAAADETDSLNYVGALLDAYATGIGQSWYVDPLRAVRVGADPTAPSALLIPDSGVLGTAVESQAGTIVGRYIDSTTHDYKIVTYGSSLPERGVDWTARGEMSAAAATALCQGVWAPLQAQPGWTNGLPIQGGELRSLGYQALPLWAFTAGQMIRLLGVRDLRGMSANTDVVIGESIWNPGEDSLRLNPVGKVARDVRSILDPIGGVAMSSFAG